ncbi:endonuclease/exonuclease/phosphatase family protein [Streptomyces sp. SID5614]|uniref:endonuclease/exonuclease/phosphatase family protein n=1 Tax=Streptomyces sp. SID5614 TaxID=2690306 RepID=UPI001F2C5265|nr:endonuclease/exonuclease/phosphatase family protein [Streptomyces sp. SID5614]
MAPSCRTGSAPCRFRGREGGAPVSRPRLGGRRELHRDAQPAAGGSSPFLPGPSFTDRPPAHAPHRESRGALDEADGVVPGGVTVLDDEVPAVANLDAELLDALRRAARNAADDAVTFTVNSGWRSAAYQKELLRRAVAQHGSEAEAARWVATATTSPHGPVDVKMDAGPLGDAKPAEVKMAYNQGMRTTVTTDHGPLAVYVAHLGSVRVNPRAGLSSGQRDAGAQSPGQAVAAEENERVVLLGDLNGALDDRAYAGLTSRMESAQETAGAGFGFSWPATLPVVRIDQILVRGVKPESAWVLPATGSDHRPVAARISW